MNNRQLGNKLEKMVGDYLVSQGWLVERGFKKVAFIGGRMLSITKDLFGSVDILACRNGSEVRMIQVTAGNTSERKKKILETWHDGELWEHMKGKVFKVHKINGETSLVEARIKKVEER